MQNKFIKNRDFILFGSQPWDADIGSNFKDMAFELARYNRVLYINRALDRFSLLKSRSNPAFASRLASIKNDHNAPWQVQPGLWVFNPATILESINWIPAAAVHDFLNRINNKRLAREINKAASQLHFNAPILINDNDFIRGRHLKEMVSNSFYIFYKRDDMLGVDYFRRHGPRLQAASLKEADLVATNSAYLARLSRVHNSNSVDIGQGCDLGLFRPGSGISPRPFEEIRKPVIGYTGYTSAWRIDVEVIRYLAEELPGCSVVLIGPVDPLFKTDRLEGLVNVHFVPAKAATKLPAYIEQFDICINPQVLNNTTIGNYPRKIDEYLAMGKPVVATETETMTMFRGYVQLCRTKEEFLTAIQNFLSNPSIYNSEDVKQQRMLFARTHTWEASIEKLGEAYFATRKDNMANESKPRGSGLSQRQQHTAAVLFIGAYLLFVYIKFIFF